MLVDNAIVILRKVIVNEVIDHNIRVTWFVPLDATYVHYKVTTILCKIDIYDGLMEQYHGKQIDSLRICYN
jgi:hypothetical protein